MRQMVLWDTACNFNAFILNQSIFNCLITSAIGVGMGGGGGGLGGVGAPKIAKLPINEAQIASLFEHPFTSAPLPVSSSYAID